MYRNDNLGHFSTSFDSSAALEVDINFSFRCEGLIEEYLLYSFLAVGVAAIIIY